MHQLAKGTRKITKTTRSNQETLQHKHLILLIKVPQKPQLPLPRTNTTPLIPIQLGLTQPLIRQIRQPKRLPPIPPFKLHKPAEMRIRIRNPNGPTVRRVIGTTNLTKEIMHLSRLVHLCVNDGDAICGFGAEECAGAAADG